MDVFECRVRPGGTIFHEVRKYGLTAAEVVLLRVIHGGDETVIVEKRTGVVPLNAKREYARLSEAYNPKVVAETFGPVAVARLPETLDEDMYEDAVEGKPNPAPKKGRKPAKVEPVDDDEDDMDMGLN